MLQDKLFGHYLDNYNVEGITFLSSHIKYNISTSKKVTQ